MRQPLVEVSKRATQAAAKHPLTPLEREWLNNVVEYSVTLSDWLVSEEAGLLNPSSWQGMLFYAIIFSLGAFLLMRLVRLTARASLREHARFPIDRTAITFLSQVLQIIIFTAAFAFYAHLIPELRALGTALLAGVSIASVVVGLAAQNTLGNVIAGISLLLYRPFHVGDRVQLIAPTGVETGTVEDVTLGYTVLQTFDNRRIVVPNSLIANEVTINLTAVDPKVMAVIPVSIGYTADLDRARAILIELARAHPQVLEVVGCPLTDIGPSSLALSLRAWTQDAGAAGKVRSELLEQLKKRFDEEGIELPYPYGNVVIKHSENENPDRK